MEILIKKAEKSSKVNRLKSNQNGTECGIMQRISIWVSGRKVELSLASFPNCTYLPTHIFPKGQLLASCPREEYCYWRIGMIMSIEWEKIKSHQQNEKNP